MILGNTLTPMDPNSQGGRIWQLDFVSFVGLFGEKTTPMVSR